MKPTLLNSTSEAIDALGGNAAVARLCSTPDKKVSSKAVSNWRNDLFPAKTYVVLKCALTTGKNKGLYVVPDSLWHMITPPASSCSSNHAGAAA